MTHVLVCNRGKEAWLFADSALSGSRVASNPVSSFGERLQNVEGDWLHEGFQKIARIGNVALAFSGMVSKWHSFASTFRQERTRGASPEDSFRVAVASLLPLDAPTDLATVMAYYDRDNVCVYTFNACGDSLIRLLSANKEIQLGLADNDTRHNASLTLSIFHQVEGLDDPQDRFASALSLLQTRAFRDRLPLQGIGGTLSACRIHSEGIAWQPDISYAVAHGERLAGR